MQPQSILKRKCFSRATFVIVIIWAVWGTARAGDGTFTTTDGVNGTFNFCVTVQFHATEGELQNIRRAFQKASDLLAEATEGHHRFGTINIVNDGGAAESAEFAVQKIPGQRGAAADGGLYGFRGGRGAFAYNDIFAPLSNPPNPPSPAYDYWLYRAAFTIAHEFSHQAYDVNDEYSGWDLSNPSSPQYVRLHANCASGAEPGTPFVGTDDTNLSYCLMDDFEQRGGVAINDFASRRFTLKEFCVASNHDQLIAGGPNITNNQSFKHNNMSCWQTIASLCGGRTRCTD